jgi:hypothetical protein
MNADDDTELDLTGDGELTDLQRKAVVRAFDDLTSRLRQFQIDAINEAFRLRYVPKSWRPLGKRKLERVYLGAA